MLSIKKLVVAAATAGLAVCGTVAAGGGVAHAATNQAVADCSTGSSNLLALNVFPSCATDGSTAVNPTSVTVTANPSFFSTLSALPGINALLTLLGQSLAVSISYKVACSVNGQTATYFGAFQATSASQTQTVDLQTAVGSPEPNSCIVSNLTATSLVSLSTPLLVLLGGTTFDFGVSAAVNTGVAGAIYLNSGTTSKSAGANTCLDDAGNGNAGSKIQAYQCNSGLAQSWLLSSNHSIVRNGACLAQSGSNAVLAPCVATHTAQHWTVNGMGGHFGEIVNASTHQCLTAASPKNFTQITVKACTGAATQQWTGPNVSPA